MSTNGAVQVQSKAGLGKVDYSQDTENNILVTLTGQSLETDSRVPINVVIVADVSSSMSTSQKIENVKRSINLLLSHLSDKDYAALIEYDSEARVLSESLKMEGSNKQRLTNFVSGLTPRGMTTFSGALGLSFQVASSTGAKEGYVNRIIFFTDGCPTTGVQDPGKLVQMTENGVPSGWQVTTMGYGLATDESVSPRRAVQSSSNNWNPTPLHNSYISSFNMTGMSGDVDLDLLDKLAKAGKGNTYYMKDADTAAKAFATELGGLLTTVAQDITVTFEPIADRIDVKEVLEDYTVEDKGSSLEVKIPDVMSEEAKYVTFKVLCKKQGSVDNCRAAKVACIKVRYLDTNTGKYVTAEHSCKPIQWVESGKQDMTVDPDIATQIAVLDTIKAQAEAQKRADAGDYLGAAATLDAAFVSLTSTGTERGGRLAKGVRRMKGIVSSQADYTRGHNLYGASLNEFSSGRSGGGAFDDTFLNSVQCSMRADFGSSTSDDLDSSQIVVGGKKPKTETTPVDGEPTRTSRSKKTSVSRY
jgi:hypothetical protein